MVRFIFRGIDNDFEDMSKVLIVSWILIGRDVAWMDVYVEGLVWVKVWGEKV